VMPEDLATTRQAMRFLASEVSRDTYVNVMNQYRPCGRAFEDSRINRAVTRAEYARALEVAQEEGMTRLDERAAFRLRFF
jgi:putative pyruvate formate lyase activating enzyme